ncbi:hypothetical protein JCM18905_1529 [Vibrio sp. JCM 18905]|nr:hypothetical protein JCM18905_1529 [Vibrio sp. JCM 18905]
MEAPTNQKGFFNRHFHCFFLGFRIPPEAFFSFATGLRLLLGFVLVFFLII